MRVRIAIVLCTVLLAVGSLSCFAAGQYQLIDLGSMYTYSAANDINDNGQIVGLLKTQDGQSHACIWQNGNPSDLGTFGGTWSGATSINNAGLVAGTYAFTRSGSHRHAFSLQDGTFQDISPVDEASGLYSACLMTANRVNSVGQIAGATVKQNALKPTQYDNIAAIWQGNQTTLLGVLGGSMSVAYDVNDNGIAVGVSEVNGGRYVNSTYYHYMHAFIYTGGVMSDLGLLEGDYTQGGASAINTGGLVVGYSGNTDKSFTQACTWRNGQVYALSTLGGSRSGANDVNDLGQIIGSSTTLGGERRAVLWQNNSIIDLNTVIAPNSGWLLTDPRGVNNKGQIVGYGTYGGQTRAFLLNPVPEPSSLVALLCGLSGVGGMMLRKRK